MMSEPYIVIGGGISGVSCAEELSRLEPGSDIILFSASKLIKSVANFKKVSRALEEFDIEETNASQLSRACPNVQVVHRPVTEFLYDIQSVCLGDGSPLRYRSLCICAGGAPKLIATGNPRVIGIRDTESVQEFQRKLSHARRIAVIGNGGIAVELVYEVTGCEIIWAIKHQSVGHAFFDAGAAAFFLSSLKEEPAGSGTLESSHMKRHKHVVDEHQKGSQPASSKCLANFIEGREDRWRQRGQMEADGGREDRWSCTVLPGSALGPDWSSDLAMCGAQAGRRIHIEYECEVDSILLPDDVVRKGLLVMPFPASDTGPSTDDAPNSKCSRGEEGPWPIYVLLTNGKVFGCDFIVSATGVTPNGASFVPRHKGSCELKLADDGGIVVDTEMRTSIANVYAAGDVCTTEWYPQPALWFQMRLWTQARQMGVYAARCMAAHSNGEEIQLDFCFELFAHSTKFFGFKVILLGKYNGQDLANDFEILLRYTKGAEYIKAVVHKGKMVGAILIGETDLEETFENLILNQMDVSRFGEGLLDPNIDIEDYFD